MVGKWEYLPVAEEDALHTSVRLLGIESRPFQRLSAALVKPDALKATRPVQGTSPPRDASAVDEEAAALATEQENQNTAARNAQLMIMSELKMFDYAIARMELTTKSNITERERYAQEMTAITAKQQNVRENIEVLRAQLKEAQDTLEVRKTYDELTEKITNSKMLKPRDEQAAAHAKLDEEISELQQEVEASKRSWAERRVQFGRIMGEATEMLLLIKDDKEEAERKEGMMKDVDDVEDGEGSTTRGGVSQVGTPRPDGNGTPLHVNGDEHSHTLKVPHDRLARFSRDNSVAPSAPSGVEDAEMSDAGAGKDNDSSGIEEGEEEEDDGELREMDES